MVRFFGTTIGETVNAFRGTHLGSKKAAPVSEPADWIKAIGRIIVSVALIALAGYLFAGDDQKQKLAWGLVGTLTGYWLK